MTELDPTTEREGSGGRVVVLLLLGLTLIFGGAYVAAHYVAGDKVPRGTTVAGVDVGGYTQEQAAEVLEEGLAERVEQPVRLQVGGKGRQVRPERLGMEVDHVASVAGAGGERSWHPARLWNHFTGGEEREAVVTYDEASTEEFFDALDERFGQQPVNGAIAFQGAEVRVREPEAGRLLDRDAARESIEEAWLDETDEAALQLQERDPEVDREAVRTTREEFAEPAVSGPVRLAFGDIKPVRLRPVHFTPALSVVADDGELVPRLDDQQLAKAIADRTGEANEPVDAQIRLVDGRPEVIPAKPGVSYNQKQVNEAFLDVVTRSGDQRRLEVDARTTKPDRTTKDARQLGVKEKVSTFTTHYPHAEYRNVNIGQAAENINGTLLEPGETFSFNDTVGERTAANGFTEGFIISDGVFKEDYGGGVSQMATTLFNAMFFAGLEDVEHEPHSFYIDRYPVGREATVVWGALDLKFRNDTDHGVLIQSFIDPSTPGSQGSVTVTMWSTKTWDISTTTSERHNLTSPDTRRISDPQCTPHEGYGGFDIDVTRIFRPAGSDEVARRQTFETTYTPSDTVICVEPDPPPSERSGGSGGGNGGNNNGGGN